MHEYGIIVAMKRTMVCLNEVHVTGKLHDETTLIGRKAKLQTVHKQLCAVSTDTEVIHSTLKNNPRSSYFCIIIIYTCMIKYLLKPKLGT